MNADEAYNIVSKYTNKKVMTQYLETPDLYIFQVIMETVPYGINSEQYAVNKESKKCVKVTKENLKFDRKNIKQGNIELKRSGA